VELQRQQRVRADEPPSAPSAPLRAAALLDVLARVAHAQGREIHMRLIVRHCDPRAWAATTSNALNALTSWPLASGSAGRLCKANYLRALSMLMQFQKVPLHHHFLFCSLNSISALLGCEHTVRPFLIPKLVVL
jgi:hypothetical protein